MNGKARLTRGTPKSRVTFYLVVFPDRDRFLALLLRRRVSSSGSTFFMRVIGTLAQVMALPKEARYLIANIFEVYRLRVQILRERRILYYENSCTSSKLV